MSDKDERPTQTTPEGQERDALDLPGKGGTSIPVPKRDDVLGALRKVARPDRSPDGDRSPEE